MFFFGDCLSWKLPQNYVHVENHGDHPALELKSIRSRTCATVMLHRWLMSIEEYDLLSLDDSLRSRRLMSHVRGSVSAGHFELRRKNVDAVEGACTALPLFSQRRLG